MKKFFKWMAALAAAAIVMMCLVAFTSPQAKPPCRFITADHPIDIIDTPTGRWTYYFIGTGTPASVAEAARQELIPLGFVEDTTQKPWFHFTKGSQEVVVCNFDEIGSGRGGVSPMKPYLKPSGVTPVVWVKTPSTDHASLALFQIRKLILRW